MVFSFDFLQLSVELMADQIQLFVLFLVLLPFLLIGKTLLGQLANLHLIVLGIEYLPFEVFDLDAIAFYFIGEALYFYRLEDHHKREVLG